MADTIQYPSGHVRGDNTDKIDYSLAVDGPMFKRLAMHLTRQANNHGGKRNWMQANSLEEKARAKESAFRHFMQWYYEEIDEDHAAAVEFNINLFEYLKEKLG